MQVQKGINFILLVCTLVKFCKNLFPDIDADRGRCADGHRVGPGHVHDQEGSVGVALQHENQVSIKLLKSFNSP